MAMTNRERQRRWIEKNRALHNLRRRKSNGEGLHRIGEKPQCNGPSPSPPISKVDQLRAIIADVHNEPTEPVVKLSVYRDDYGRVITEAQWNTLQKRKAEAKNGGYEIDEYSQ